MTSQQLPNDPAPHGAGETSGDSESGEAGRRHRTVRPGPRPPRYEPAATPTPPTSERAVSQADGFA
jgi:hypothetical protein